MSGHRQNDLMFCQRGEEVAMNLGVHQSVGRQSGDEAMLESGERDRMGQERYMNRLMGQL